MFNVQLDRKKTRYIILESLWYDYQWISHFITRPRNGQYYFACWHLSSFVTGGQAADTPRRASRVTSRFRAAPCLLNEHHGTNHSEQSAQQGSKCRRLPQRNEICLVLPKLWHSSCCGSYSLKYYMVSGSESRCLRPTATSTSNGYRPAVSYSAQQSVNKNHRTCQHHGLNIRFRSPVLWKVDLMFCACFFFLFFPNSLFPTSANWYFRNFSTWRGFTRQRSAAMPIS